MTAESLLLKYSLNKTTGRLKILNVFLESHVALSEKEIQGKLIDVCDRATIYRTIKAFTESGIIHPIAAEGTLTKYVLKKNPAEHLHFKCTDCGEITCLTEIQLKDYVLPDGFIKKDTNFVVIGTCENCSNQNVAQ